MLAEVYDRDSAEAPGRLAGLSTLAFAGEGNHPLVLGFTIDGAAPKRLLIRAVGPGLEPFGVTGVLADPKVAVIPTELNRAVATNDDWSADSALVSAFNAAGAFPLERGSKDAALVVSLPPGGYTLAVSGVAGTTGAALVEIYDLDP